MFASWIHSCDGIHASGPVFVRYRFFTACLCTRKHAGRQSLATVHRQCMNHINWAHNNFIYTTNLHTKYLSIYSIVCNSKELSIAWIVIKVLESKKKNANLLVYWCIYMTWSIKLRENNITLLVGPNVIHHRSVVHGCTCFKKNSCLAFGVAVELRL